MISPRIIILVLTALICREVAGQPEAFEPMLALLSMLGVSLGFGLLVKAFAIAELQPAIRSRGLNFLTAEHGLFATNPRPKASDGISSSSDIISHHVHDASSGLNERTSAREHPGQPSHADNRAMVAAYVHFSNKRRLVESVWCLALPAALLATGWAACLNELESRGMPVALTMLGLSVPTLLVFLLMDLTTAQFDELVASSNDDATTHEQDPSSWLPYFRLRMRFGELASYVTCLLPVLVLTALMELGQGPAKPLVGPLGPFLLPAGGLVVFLLVYPYLLSRWSGAAEPGDPSLVAKVDGFCKQLGMCRTPVRVVPSEGRWWGAAVVGWLPGCRQLWLVDGLLRELTDRELEMVVLHELAHVARRHFLWRIAPVVIAAGVGGLSWLYLEPLVTTSDVPADASQWLAAVATALTLYLGIGASSRASELDADRHACSLAWQLCPWATDRRQAARSLAGALRRLVPESESSTRQTWLHPSLNHRLKALKCIDRSQQSCSVG